ncbi:hypothetical protein AB0H43_21965 [Hamadaea sp. NPDC050747]|uniref:hypothetical protein n=1 Tax=Hamadaea sp. NPDC050747 TaxID=3155789 RepID=UPI0033CA1726
MPLVDGNPYASALRIQEPGVVAALVDLFDSVWQRRIDPELALVPDATEQDKEVRPAPAGRSPANRLRKAPTRRGPLAYAHIGR